MPVPGGYGAASLDFHCHYEGLAFSIEAKSGSKLMTDRQKTTAKSMLKAGGAVFLVNAKTDGGLLLWLSLTKLLAELRPKTKLALGFSITATDEYMPVHITLHAGNTHKDGGISGLELDDIERCAEQAHTWFLLATQGDADKVDLANG